VNTNETLIEWLLRIIDSKAHGIKNSKVFFCLYSKNYHLNPQSALELGIAMMLDKPIAVIAVDDQDIPNNIQKAAFLVERITAEDKTDIEKTIEKISVILNKEIQC